MRKTWAEVSCQIPESMVDSVAEFLSELGSGGVSTGNLDVDTFSVDDIVSPETVTVSAYFEPDLAEEKATALATFLQTNGPLFDGFTYVPPQINEVADEEWSTAWKAHFKPIRVGRRLVIKPTWEEYEAEPDDIILHLDPGMAFGTGGHPTTLLCLRALEDAFDAPEAPKTVLDVGTGSGILAIAAAKLGAELVVGIDIDEEAVEVARGNIRLNECHNAIAVAATPLDDLTETYDVVVANILAEDLARMAASLVKRLGPQGLLVMSGILVEKESVVTDAFRDFPLSTPMVSQEGEWLSISYTRK